MEKLYSNIIGMPVFLDDVPRAVNTVKDVVIDPESGKLIAFVVDISKNEVIAPVDVVSLSDSIKVNDSRAIEDGSNILRLEEVNKKNARFIHNKVETEGGDYIGRVFDLTINGNTFELAKIHVAKGLLGLFRYDTRIIGVKNIVEVLPEKIVVKDGLKTVKEEIKGEVRVEDMAVS
ncbi:MAG: PRC-barrel domain-containing protein [Candidatus Peregrinibacteria bacterium]